MKPPTQIPLSTYRLQLNAQFTFKDTERLIPYLHALGISHIYISPILQSKKGSAHGYDIVDHSRLHPELGNEADLESLVKKLREKNMGVILDIVPNHMYVTTNENKWWSNVLENGPSSPFAKYFDIDWFPPRNELVNKVLLPFLDQQYGDALENQSLSIAYQDGSFLVQLPFMTLPTDPKSWNLLLEPIIKEVRKKLPENDRNLLELESISTALKHLPTTIDLEAEKIAERQREKEVIKRRLNELLSDNKPLTAILKGCLTTFNGIKGNPRSFDDLETFINVQPYRLCYWRVANDEINFRRFFDIQELAGIRTELPEVFDDTHSYIFKLIEKKFIDGIRIDHIDGLWDPEQYLIDLQTRLAAIQNAQEEHFYIVAEKILTGNEKLRIEWALHGTVGYDFLNQANGLFVYQPNKNILLDIYRNFTNNRITQQDLVYACKRLILQATLSSELYVLARQLDRISEQHRTSRDFTTEGLRAALRDVIACFPVYRSYIRPQTQEIHEEDQRYVVTAISRAKRLNPVINSTTFDFIQNVLLLQHPPGLEEKDIKERENFVMHFQQLTGPVMGKGLEDTAFYRSFPLASINEVGADPYNLGLSVESFHKKNTERAEVWPYTLTASSTHDTKRSEDVRARINVLSEIPQQWEDAITRWAEINQAYKLQEDTEFIPDANEEYLLYQTLIGTWPLYPMDPAAHLHYTHRIKAYMEKALKEAKFHTSWINPNRPYDEAVQQFLQKVLNENNHNFFNDFKAFMPKIVAAGMLNSLSEVLLKLTSPGVPNVYQGSETWDFSLVDPDNRRPIDYNSRQYLLESLQTNSEPSQEFLKQLQQRAEDGRLKLYLTRQAIQCRKRLPNLFLQGNYNPIQIKGEKQNHLIAFARTHEKKTIITIASRFFTSLITDDRPIVPSSVWGNTHLILPPELQNLPFKNLFTNLSITTQASQQLKDVLNSLPLALLESQEN